MIVEELGLVGVYLVTPTSHGDDRGFFMESFRKDQWNSLGVFADFVQDNHSLSVSAGTVRGLHYQEEPFAQAKLLRVLSGAVFDVVVDIRQGSPTFGRWVSAILTADNRRQIFVPKGFAHGFCTLVPQTQVLYKVDAYYSPDHDRGIVWNDPDIGVDWPVTQSQAVLSTKDSALPFLGQL